MRNAAFYIVLTLLSLFVTVSFGQTCPFSVGLNNTGGPCLGSSLLNISSANPISEIVWYNGSTEVSRVKAAAAGTSGITVAGGNGAGLEQNQLYYPVGVYVDDNGTIFVSEHSSNRVQEWAQGANLGITVAGGNGAGPDDNQLSAPTGIYLDSDGNVYISDPNNHRVQKWIPGATTQITVAGGNNFGAAANQLWYPYDVFIDANKNIYIADRDNHRVQKWANGATTGVTVAGGNGFGFAPNQLNSPTGVFVDAIGNIYVADHDNNRVQKWAPGATSGVTVAGGNGAGFGPNQLNQPFDVFLDGNGNLYITDYGNYRVQKWAPGASSGVTVAGGNGPGFADHQMYYAFGLFVASSGDIYIADAYASRVQKWTQASPVLNTSYTPTSAGSYRAVVTDDAGCSVTTNSVTVVASLVPTINVSITSGSQITCAGMPVTFTATPTNEGTTPVFQWKLNGVNAGTNSPTYTNSILTNGDVVRCEMTSNLSCGTSTTAISNNIVITINPKPTVTLSNDLVIDKGAGVQLNASVTGNIVSYKWSPATGLDNSTIQNPMANPLVNTTYKLEVVTATNCEANDEITVIVLTNITAPNVFSPNGDGINDFWEIKNLQYYPGCTVDIYNRYGQTVFRSVGYSNPWDGNYNGKPLPLDSYYYIIDPKKGEKQIAGNITILR